MVTKEEMIELAKQAGWEYAHGESGYEPLWAFAKLIAEKEREACAELIPPQYFHFRDWIRARGKND